MIRDKDHMSLTKFGLIWGLFITFHFGLIFNDLDYFQFWTEFRSFGLISKNQSEFEKQYEFRKKVVQMEEQMKTLNEGMIVQLNYCSVIRIIDPFEVQCNLNHKRVVIE